MLKKKEKLNFSHKQGFTLVELLLVIGIIATLAVVVFVALDPAKRFADARDARRTSDVEAILSAVHQYVIDNKGAFPTGLTVDTEQGLGDVDSTECANFSGGCDAQNAACLDLLSNPDSNLSKYLKTMPFDPQSGTAEDAGYTILRDSNGIVTVKACYAEGANYISVSR